MRTTIKQSKLPGFVIETVYGDNEERLCQWLLPDYLCMPVGTDVSWSYPTTAEPIAIGLVSTKPPSLWQKLKALLKNA